jgi:geranylgeranyl pyrophosphate synthase
LEVLDELADGQASDLALALLGESIELVRGLPEPLAPRLLAHWGALWTRCAAAQTLDAALSVWPDLTLSQAIRVATTSGLVTQWAVEAGAIVADAAPGLVAPLAVFGRYLGTAQKLLHALSPGAHRCGDLRRLSGNLTLAVAHDSGLAPTEPEPGVLDHAVLRRRLVECDAPDYARACADQCRRHAAEALRLFAGAGGNPTPLAGLLDLPPELRFVQMEDAQP